MTDYVANSSCLKEHKRVDEKLERHERWLGEHECKIDTLAKSDAVNSTEIKNLCKSIDSQNKRMGNLTNAIWGLVASIGMVLFGFLIWYIQSLPRG